jgi:hypothetical protein
MTPEEMARMTPDERQTFFDREGYWPMGPIVTRRKVSLKTAALPHSSRINRVPQRPEESPEEIYRFPRLPRKIETHAELAELIEQRQGFLFNNRADRKMLHRVNCESLEVMSTRAYEKLFFDDLDTAKDWLDSNYGTNGWEVCGRCCW